MEPGSCNLYSYNPLYLSLLLIFFLLDVTLTIMYSSYRFNPKSGHFSENSSHYDKDAKTSNDPMLPGNINVLWLAARLFGIIFGIFAFLIIHDLFCIDNNVWATLLIALIVPVFVMLIEYIISGITARHAENWARMLSGISKLCVFLFKPLYNLYESFKPDNVRHDYTFNEVEANLREWVNNASDNTSLKEDERKMVRSILGFSDTLSREIMIPRIDMTAIDVDVTLREAAATVLSSGHSRLPVYEDEIDNIIGVIYAKDLLKIYSENPEDQVLKEFLRPALFVPESKKAGELLSEMQSSGIHMVIVVDEYGGTSGIVSMEDIVEEIVGEIRDEYDESEEELIYDLGPDEYSLLGRIDLEDVNDLLGTHITRESADTLAGFMYSQIGRVPVGNEEIKVEDWIFQIEELAGNRIRRIHVKRAKPDGNTEGEEENSTDD